MNRFRFFLALVAVAVFGGGCSSTAVSRTALRTQIAESHRILATDTVGVYDRTWFEFEGCEGWVVEPHVPAPDNRWVWCMEWPTAFPERTAQQQLLAAGYRWIAFNPAHSRYLKTAEGNQNDAMLTKRRRFQKFLVERLGLAPKCGLIGMSWGGFYSVRYASTYPDCVNAIYLDAPLLDFSTLANYRKSGWKRLQAFYPFATADYDGANDPYQSVNRAAPIAAAKIPVFLAYGETDGTVPPKSNCERFVADFRRHGGEIEVVRQKRGHHPHGLESEESWRLVRFFDRAAGSSRVTVATLSADGKTNVREDLQTLIDGRSAAGGGVVVLPKGTYDTTGFFLKDNVTLYLEKDATLAADPDWRRYPILRLEHSEVADGVWRALVGATEARNVAVTGAGTIDMRGAACTARGNDRPRGLLFHGSSNVSVSGVRLVNGASWMCYFKECADVLARRVTVYSHQNVNNDGFDIEARNVLIDGCAIDSGDDGICLKSDNPNFEMKNVEIRNCTVASTCCAYKLGTASSGPCRDIRLFNSTATPCVFTDQATVRHAYMRGAPGVTNEHTGIAGVAIENVDGGIVEGVCVSNISIRGYSTPMFVRLGARRPNRMSSGEKTALRNVVFHNVEAEATSRIASSVTGVPGLRPEDIVFRLIRLRLLSGGTEADAKAAVPEKEAAYPEPYMFDRMPLPGHAFYVRHADNVLFDFVTTSFADGAIDARPPIFSDDATGLAIRNRSFAECRSPLVDRSAVWRTENRRSGVTPLE